MSRVVDQDRDVTHVQLSEKRVEGGSESDSDEDIPGIGAPASPLGREAVYFVVVLCLFSSLGGLLFGYDTGINGGVQVSNSFISDLCVGQYDVGESDSDNNCFADDVNQQPEGWVTGKSMFVSLLSLGAMVGAILGGVVTERVGRRWTIAIGTFIFCFFTVFCISMSSMTPLIVGRFGLGVPVGMLSFVVPMYAAEVAPAELRGVLASLMQFSIVLGILIATVLAVPFATMAGGWRIAMGICGIPAAILGVGIFCFPESPRWLCKYKSMEAAKEALVVLRKTAEVETEVGEIALALKAEDAEEDAGYMELFSPEIRGRLMVACMLQLLQQMTGVNSIFYYAPTIFAQAGFDDPLMAGLICGVANLIGTIMGLYLVDTSGRRTLLLVGAAGMTAGMLTSAILLLTIDVKAHPLAGWLAVIATCFFVVNFAYSWGPICWVYPAEIFPMRVRAKAVSIATLCNWVMNVSVASMVPLLLKAFSAGGLFLIFGIFGIGCGVFVYFFVPETAGKSLEEINNMWSKEAELTSPRGRGYLGENEEAEPETA